MGVCCYQLGFGEAWRSVSEPDYDECVDHIDGAFEGARVVWHPYLDHLCGISGDTDGPCEKCGTLGACCEGNDPNNPTGCFNTTPLNCGSLGGRFGGIGNLCEDADPCGATPDDFGACCARHLDGGGLSVRSCQYTSSFACRGEFDNNRIRTNAHHYPGMTCSEAFPIINTEDQPCDEEGHFPCNGCNRAPCCEGEPETQFCRMVDVGTCAGESFPLGMHCQIDDLCEPLPSETQACCLDEETCEDLGVIECRARGGIPSQTGQRCVSFGEDGEPIQWECAPPTECLPRRDHYRQRYWTAKLCDDVSFSINKFESTIREGYDADGARSRHQVRSSGGTNRRDVCKHIGGRLVMDEDNFVHLGYCSNPRFSSPQRGTQPNNDWAQYHRARIGSDDREKYGLARRGDHVFVGKIHTPYWFEVEVSSTALRCGGAD